MSVVPLTGGASKHTNNAMMSKRELERVSHTLDQQEKRPQQDEV